MSSGPFGGGAEAVCGGAASEATCASSWRTVGAASASPPSRCASRLRSSTAPSESSPASSSGVSMPTFLPITSETTARTATLASAGGSAGARPMPAGCVGAVSWGGAGAAEERPATGSISETSCTGPSGSGVNSTN
eukprot:scaffold7589_cov75-Phaeocystis_antarctica.AAC.1